MIDRPCFAKDKPVGAIHGRAEGVHHFGDVAGLAWNERRFQLGNDDLQPAILQLGFGKLGLQLRDPLAQLNFVEAVGRRNLCRLCAPRRRTARCLIGVVTESGPARGAFFDNPCGVVRAHSVLQFVEFGIDATRSPRRAGITRPEATPPASNYPVPMLIADGAPRVHGLFVIGGGVGAHGLGPNRLLVRAGDADVLAASLILADASAAFGHFATEVWIVDVGDISIRPLDMPDLDFLRLGKRGEVGFGGGKQHIQVTADLSIRVGPREHTLDVLNRLFQLLGVHYAGLRCLGVALRAFSMATTS